MSHTHLSSKDVHFLDNVDAIDAAMKLATIQATMDTRDNNSAMTLDHIGSGLVWFGFFV